jgi:DNA-binding transcriptional LysR family regulator
LPALSQHRYDLGFVRDYHLDREVFEWIPVAADRLLVAVACEHRLAGRKSVSLAELADESFIFFSPGTLIHNLAMQACRGAGFEPRVFHATPRAASIIDMVSSNSGLALIMEKVLQYYRRPDVVAIPLEQAIQSRVVIAYPKDRAPSRSATTFIDFIQQQLAG